MQCYSNNQPLLKQDMCYESPCATCGKRSWAGCGRHAAGVMSRIPAEQQCTCKPLPAPAEGKPAELGGLLSSIWSAVFPPAQTPSGSTGTTEQ